MLALVLPTSFLLIYSPRLCVVSPTESVVPLPRARDRDLHPHPDPVLRVDSSDTPRLGDGAGFRRDDYTRYLVGDECLGSLCEPDSFEVIHDPDLYSSVESTWVSAE